MRRKIIGVFSPILFLWSSTALAEATIETPSYGWLLFKTLFVLLGICILAFVGLRYLSKVSVGQPGPMKILGRLPIEGRRSVLVIDIAGKTLIIGNSEAGMQNLGELNENERAVFLEKNELKNSRSFKERLTDGNRLPKSEAENKNVGETIL